MALVFPFICFFLALLFVDSTFVLSIMLTQRSPAIFGVTIGAGVIVLVIAGVMFNITGRFLGVVDDDDHGDDDGDVLDCYP